MWSSHSFRIASWNASAEALVDAAAVEACSVDLAMPPFAGAAAAGASTASRHTTAAAAAVSARVFRVLFKAPLPLIRTFLLWTKSRVLTRPRGSVKPPTMELEMDWLQAVGDRGLRATLAYVLGEPRPVTADELAASQGIHRNVARSRLERLADAG